MKAHVDAGQEQHQSNIGIQEAHDNFQHIFPGHPQGDHLENGRRRLRWGPGPLAISRAYAGKPCGEQAAQLPAVTGHLGTGLGT